LKTAAAAKSFCDRSFDVTANNCIGVRLVVSWRDGLLDQQINPSRRLLSSRSRKLPNILPSSRLPQQTKEVCWPPICDWLPICDLPKVCVLRTLRKFKPPNTE
jgi:hypothetical protein